MKENYRGKALSGMAWKFAERLLTKIVTGIVSVILARILLPDDYGVISLTTVFITLFDVFVTYGFGVALVQKKDADELDFSSTFYAGFVISTLLYVALFFLAELIGDFYDSQLLCSVLRVLGLRLPISALGTVQNAIASRKLMFKQYFWASFIGTILSAVVGIWMAYAGCGVWALVGQQLTDIVVDKIFFFYATKWYPKRCFSFQRVKRLLAYGWKILVSGLINTGYVELRSLIIGKMYTKADLAYYDKGKTFPSVIENSIHAPINDVLFPILAKEQDDLVRVKDMTRKTITTSCFFVFPAMVGLAVVAPTLVPLVYTAKWNPIVPFMQMLCVSFMFRPMQYANIQAIKAIGKSDVYLRLEIIKKSVGIALLLASIWFGVFWIVFAAMATEIAATVINAIPNKKLLNYSFAEQTKDILPYLFMSLVMGAAVFAMNYLPIHHVARLAIQIIVGAGLYYCAARLMKPAAYQYAQETIKGFRKKRGTSNSEEK
ncbi:MAG: lipopolysaccharide biosynthesis protein [Oscillospiraceae bacterium]|nr:lipopolysaccharide biosynthesis protein [Oscillospiraceae bacterium]